VPTTSLQATGSSLQPCQLIAIQLIAHASSLDCLTPHFSYHRNWLAPSSHPRLLNRLSTHLPTHLPACPPTCLLTHLPACMSACPLTCPPACPPAHLPSLPQKCHFCDLNATANEPLVITCDGYTVPLKQ